MSVYNQGIMDLISSDRYEAHYVFQEIRKRWPQINEQTRVTLVNHPTVYLAKPQPISTVYNMKWVVVSGWLRLKLQLMPPRYIVEKLDDPVERQKYQVRVWSALFSLPKYQFWRFTGRLFHRQDWTRRGMEQQPDPVMSTTAIMEREEIRLERYGWQLRTPDSLFNPMAGYGELICAYYPPQDTFYVYKR